MCTLTKHLCTRCHETYSCEDPDWLCPTANGDESGNRCPTCLLLDGRDEMVYWDFTEAEAAWVDFTHKRYFRTERKGSVVISEMIYPMMSPWMMAQGKETFVNEFMRQRGWRWTEEGWQ